MNKKFISWVSAVALASSVIVVPLSANAEGETVLWSDTFNAYENLVAHTTNAELVGDVLLDGTSVAKNEYNGIAGITLLSTDRADDSSYFQMKENENDAADKYLTTTVSRFSNANRGASIKFNETYTSDKDLVLASKVMFHNEGGTTFDNAFKVGSTVINMDTIGASADAWHDIKVVINSSGTSVYLDDNTTTAVATGSDVSLSEIKFAGTVNGVDDSSSTGAQKSSAHPIGYPTFAFNDMVVYTAENGAESVVPEAADQTAATPTPDPTELPDAAPIETETVIDFDANAIEINNRSNSGRMNTSIGAVTDIGNDTMLGILEAVNPEDNGNCGAADINLSPYTKGKSHVIVSYDFYMPDAGRFKVIASDAEVQRSKPTEMDNGIFMVGKTGGSGMTNITAGAWNTVTIDADFATGNVKYEVQSGDTTVTSGTTTTDKKELTYLQFASWSAVTAYVDNIKIQTGGELEGAIATPEPASEVEGSGIDLLPENATKFADFAAAEGTAEKILNHTSAKPAVNEASVNIYDADANIRGKAVYAAYDVLVNVGDKLVLKAVGSDASKVGTQFALEGKEDGKVDVYAFVDKGDRVNIDSTLVCGTWYRVVIEIPQLNNEGTTNTGNATYTIYRIDSNDPSATADIAVQKSGLTPRNLNDRAAVSLVTEVTGTPYIDNGVTYLAAQSTGGDTPEPTVATPEPAGTAAGSGVNLVPENARETVGTFEAAEGDASAVTNHANAKKAVTTTATAINAYSGNARGNAIYAAYDVYVTIGSKIAVTPYGDEGKAQGSSLILEGLENGTIKMSIPKDSTTTIDVPNDLVHDTWYRVVMEIPQKGTSEKTYAENMKYSVYRIDSADPTKTTLAVSADAYGRGLAGDTAKGLASIGVEVTGDVYIDNGAVYLKKATADTWYRYMLQVNDGVKTVTSIEEIDDPTKTSGKLGTEYYIWNALMQPYIPAAEDTPAE